MTTPNYVYRCKITRVVDGDTLDANIDLGFNLWTSDRIRLMGIDTPESRTSNKKEKVLGLASKARLKELLKSKQIYLQTSKEGKGKFGRILGTLWVGGYDVNQILIQENHARPYFGGSKGEFGDWTKEEGCDCGGKKRRGCQGTWYRWTPDGYVPFEVQQ